MRAAIFPLVCLTGLLGPLAAACAHAGEDGQLAGMEVEMNRLQVEREDKEDSFLHQDGSSAKLAPAPPPTVGQPPMVIPHTVQIGEQGSDPMAEDGPTLDGNDPNDTTPRPSIRVEGAAAGRRGARGLEHIDETLPEDAPNGGTAGPA